MSLQSKFTDDLIDAHRAKAWRWDGIYQPDKCSVCAEVPVPPGGFVQDGQWFPYAVGSDTQEP